MAKYHKSYSEDEVAFLRPHLPEFERRLQGGVRGAAKKFALEKADEFLDRFEGGVEGTSQTPEKMKERIYNWFKNTVGRTRRTKNVDGKRRHDPTLSPSPYPRFRSPGPSSEGDSPIPPTVPPPATVQAALRDERLSPQALAGHIVNEIAQQPRSGLPLLPVIDNVFCALSDDLQDDPVPIMQRVLRAATFFPKELVHAERRGIVAVAHGLIAGIRHNSTCNSDPPPGADQMTMSAEMQILRARRKTYIQWARIHAAAIETGVFDVFAQQHNSAPPEIVTTSPVLYSPFSMSSPQMVSPSQSSAYLYQRQESGIAGPSSSQYDHSFARRPALAGSVALSMVHHQTSFSRITVENLLYEADEADWVSGLCILLGLIKSLHRHTVGRIGNLRSPSLGAVQSPHGHLVRRPNSYFAIGDNAVHFQHSSPFNEVPRTPQSEDLTQLVSLHSEYNILFKNYEHFIKGIQDEVRQEFAVKQAMQSRMILTEISRQLQYAHVP